MQIHDSRVWFSAQNFVTHGLHQVGFAQTNPTVHEQWVIAFPCVISDLRRCRLSKLVRFSFNKGVKGELSIEVVRRPH